MNKNVIAIYIINNNGSMILHIDIINIIPDIIAFTVHFGPSINEMANIYIYYRYIINTYFIVVFIYWLCQYFTVINRV